MRPLCTARSISLAALMLAAAGSTVHAQSRQTDRRETAQPETARLPRAVPQTPATLIPPETARTGWSSGIPARSAQPIPRAPQPAPPAPVRVQSSIPPSVTPPAAATTTGAFIAAPRAERFFHPRTPRAHVQTRTIDRPSTNVYDLGGPWYTNILPQSTFGSQTPILAWQQPALGSYNWNAAPASSFAPGATGFSTSFAPSGRTVVAGNSSNLPRPSLAPLLIPGTTLVAPAPPSTPAQVSPGQSTPAQAQSQTVGPWTIGQPMRRE